MVHPHAFGEYFQKLHKKFGDEGSSPRVWGIRIGDKNKLQYYLVHPHAFGEY